MIINGDGVLMKNVSNKLAHITYSYVNINMHMCFVFFQKKKKERNYNNNKIYIAFFIFTS
jgi:hypothetical protein